MAKPTERELIREAEKRGYRNGTIVDYEISNMPGTDVIGSGEFKLIDDWRGFKLIKYTNGNSGRFDTIWRPDKGWTKIATKHHGMTFHGGEAKDYGNEQP